MQHDYYQVLGVDPNASFEAIRNAYRQCALRYHPDRGGSHEQMIVINEAWEILSDPERRQRYDAVRLNTANQTVQAEAEADAHQAHQEAEQYPRRWADFEAWLDGMAQDFNRAEFKAVGGDGHFILRLFPTSGNSRSGKLFVLLGAALGAAWYIATFRANHFTLIPEDYSNPGEIQPVQPKPSPTCTLKDISEGKCNPNCTILEEYSNRCRRYAPVEPKPNPTCFGTLLDCYGYDNPTPPKSQPHYQYIPPYSAFLAFLMSLVGGGWIGAAVHRTTSIVISQSRRQSFQQTGGQKEKETRQAETQQPGTEPTNESKIIVCGNCGQKLRVPIRSSRLLVKCKKCQHEFYH